MPLCLSMAGVAGCIGFEVGCIESLLSLVPSEEKPTLVYAGLSSGSIVASMLSLGLTPVQIVGKFERFTTFFQRHHHPVTHWFTHLRTLYDEFLEPDSYRRVSGKLFVGYSALTPFGLRPRVVSEFTSNADLLDALFASCHLMPYQPCPFGLYRGEISCDGAFSRGIIRPPGMRTVGITSAMVHANAFWSDWVPSIELEKAHRLYDAGQAFVQRHRVYFYQQINGAPFRVLKLPVYFNPFKYLRWVRRVLMVVLLVWLWRRFGWTCRVISKYRERLLQR